MDEMIAYRPHRSHAWFVFFPVLIGVFAFIVTGYCLQQCTLCVVVLTTIGIACIWLTKVLYDSSNIVVFFDQNGLRIAGGSYKNHGYILWEEVSYAYYVRSFKGHLFLVMSPDALSTQEIKHFANKGANSSRLCIDHVVVIYIDILQDTSKLRELIYERVTHVDVF